MKKYILILSLVMCTAFSQNAFSQPESIKYRHTLETSPLSPVLKIYGLQYGCLLTQRDELLFGFVYANIKYDAGQSHAPTLIIGYRRYLWKKLHLEYQVWPAFNDYFEINEKRYYSGFEVWNEFRLGYKFELSLGSIPISLTPQVLCGFGLHEGNKPSSFKQQVNKEPVFVYPNIFVGVRF